MFAAIRRVLEGCVCVRACVRVGAGVASLVGLVDGAVEQDGLEEPEHGRENAHHFGLLGDRRRGVVQPRHGGSAAAESTLGGLRKRARVFPVGVPHSLLARV